MGERAFRCSLNFSVNVLPDSPKYSSLQHTLAHLNLVSLVILDDQKVSVLPPLEVHLYAMFIANVLQL